MLGKMRRTTGAKKGAPVASSLGCACAARAASSLFATFFAWSYSLRRELLKKRNIINCLDACIKVFIYFWKIYRK